MAATLPVAGTPESTRALDASTVCRWVERTCAAQGLPVAITDPTAIAHLAVLLNVTCPARSTA